MASLKPNKPEKFNGRRDQFTVRSWLYQVRQYLELIEVGNEMNLDDSTKISFAASFFSGTAATWWFTKVETNTVPTTWTAFENAVTHEFVPSDSIQRSRDRMRRLSQRRGVSAYLSEFCNIALTYKE